MRRKVELRKRSGQLVRTLNEVIALSLHGSRYGGNSSADMRLAETDALALSAVTDYESVEVWVFYDDTVLWGVFDIESVKKHPDGTAAVRLEGIAKRLNRCYVESDHTLTNTTARAAVAYLMSHISPTANDMGLSFNADLSGGLDVSIPRITLSARTSAYDLMTQIAQCGDCYWEAGHENVLGSTLANVIVLSRIGTQTLLVTGQEAVGPVLAQEGEGQDSDTVDLEITETPQQTYNELMLIGGPNRGGRPYVFWKRDPLAPPGPVRQKVMRVDFVRNRESGELIAQILFNSFRQKIRSYSWTWKRLPRRINAVSAYALIRDKHGLNYGIHQVERWDCDVQVDRLSCSCYAGAPPEDDVDQLDNFIAWRVASLVNPRHGRETETVYDNEPSIYEVVSVDEDGNGDTVVDVKPMADDSDSPPIFTATLTGDMEWLADSVSVGRQVIGARLFEDDEEVSFEIIGITQPSIDDTFIEGGKLSDIVTVHNGILCIKTSANVSTGAHAGEIGGVILPVGGGPGVGHATIQEISPIYGSNGEGQLGTVIQVVNNGTTTRAVLRNTAGVTNTAQDDWSALNTFFDVIDVDGTPTLAMKHGAWVSGSTNAPINLYYDSVDDAYNSVHAQIADTSET